jgi:hypothetical protein
MRTCIFRVVQASTMTTVYRPAKVERIRVARRQVSTFSAFKWNGRLRSAIPANQYCLFEMTVPLGAGVPLQHQAEQETFWVVDGEAEFGRMAKEGPELLCHRRR